MSYDPLTPTLKFYLCVVWDFLWNRFMVYSHLYVKPTHFFSCHDFLFFFFCRGGGGCYYNVGNIIVANKITNVVNQKKSLFFWSWSLYFSFFFLYYKVVMYVTLLFLRIIEYSIKRNISISVPAKVETFESYTRKEYKYWIKLRVLCVQWLYLIFYDSWYLTVYYLS